MFHAFPRIYNSLLVSSGDRNEPEDDVSQAESVEESGAGVLVTARLGMTDPVSQFSLDSAKEHTTCLLALNK